MGNVYFKMNRYEQSIDNYNKAIFYKPDYEAAYNNRAFVYLNTGNKKSGCKDAKKACEMGICDLLKVAQSKGDCR
jgi:tetratricopeptide (TPR) repeat protein